MAVADLGLRVFLEDTASAGFGALSTNMFGFLSSFVGVAMGASRLTNEIERLNGVMDQAWADVTAGTITMGEFANIFFPAQAQVATLTDQLAQLQLAVLGFQIIGGASVDLALFTAGLFTAVQDAGELQAAMINLKIAFSLSDSQMQAMQNTLISVANNSKFTMAQVADGFTMLGEKGFTAADIIDKHVGTAMINLAEAIKIGPVPAAQLLSKTMVTFGADAAEAEKYASLLTYTFYNSGYSATELSTIFGDVGAKAHELGVNVDELSAVIDMFGRAGVAAGTTGASLRYMLTALTDPTSAAQKELADLGLTTINTNRTFYDFQNQLDAAAAAAKKTPVSFDGTLTSLAAMFAEAQKLGTIHTDKTFYEWATSTGILNSALFDSKGHFKDFMVVLQELGDKLSKLNPEQRAEAIRQLFNVKSGQGADVLFGNWDELNKKIDAYIKKVKDAEQHDVAGKDKAAQNDALGASWQRLTTTIHDFIAQVGIPIANVLTSIYTNINNMISGLASGNPSLQQFATLFLVLGAGLSIVGVVVGVLIVALSGVLAGVAGFIGPVILVAVGIAALAAGIAGIVHAIMQSGPATKFFQGLFNDLGHTINTLWTAIQPTLMPALHELNDAWIKLQIAAQPLLVFLGIIATIIGGLLVGVIHALLGMLIGALPGAIMVVTGVIQVLSGAFNVVAGVIILVFNAFKWLFGALTGNQAMMGEAGAGMLHGFAQLLVGGQRIMTGLWHMIQGVFLGAIGAIVGYVQGFVMGIVGFFTHLFDALVGHSIVTDMWNKILHFFTDGPRQALAFIVSMVLNLLVWFGNLELQAIAKVGAFIGGVLHWIGDLPGRVIGFISSMVWTVLVWFGNLELQAIDRVMYFANGLFQIFNNIKTTIISKIQEIVGGMIEMGSNIVKNIAQGITNGISFVTGAVQNVAQTISNFLPHSPAKEGPLTEADQFMPRMMQMYASGIVGNVHLVKGAMDTVGSALHPGAFTTSNMQALQAQMQGGVGGVGGNTTVNFILDGSCIAQGVINRATGQLQMAGINRLLR